MVKIPFFINGEVVYLVPGKDKLPPMGVNQFDYIPMMYTDTV